MFSKERITYKFEGTPYTVQEELGTGGFATAYKAIDPNGTPITLKTYSKFHPHKLKTVEKGFDVRIRHPGIPDHLVADAISKDLRRRLFGQGPAAIFSHIEGNNAFEEINKPLDLVTRIRRARSLLYRMIPALDAMIENGVIHHDLKSSNIIFSPKQDAATLIDTDLMTTLGAEPDDCYLGNPPGMPPEYLQNLDLNLTFDIYNLACEILYRYMDPETESLIDIGFIDIEKFNELDPEQLRLMINKLAKKRTKEKATANYSVQIKLRDLSRFPEKIRDEACGLIEFLIAAVHPDPRHRPKNGKEIAQLLETKPKADYYCQLPDSSDNDR